MPASKRQADRDFADALRACLGLGPLYGSDKPSEYGLEHADPLGIPTHDQKPSVTWGDYTSKRGNMSRKRV